MGDGANDLLNFSMFKGIPFDRTKTPRRRKLISCPKCGKKCRGQGGLMNHENAKHNASWSWHQIDMAPREYEDA